MKYAVLFFVASIIFSSQVSARTVTSFKQSDALTAIAQFMYEVGDDLPESVRLSDKKISIKNLKCDSRTSAKDVLYIAERAILQVLRYYPDEEVPFEEALEDLELYLNREDFFVCRFTKKTKHAIIQSTYFYNDSDKIHLRLDKITPVVE